MGHGRQEEGRGWAGKVALWHTRRLWNGHWHPLLDFRADCECPAGKPSLWPREVVLCCVLGGGWELRVFCLWPDKFGGQWVERRIEWRKHQFSQAHSHSLWGHQLQAPSVLTAGPTSAPESNRFLCRGRFRAFKELMFGSSQASLTEGHFSWAHAVEQASLGTHLGNPQMCLALCATKVTLAAFCRTD